MRGTSLWINMGMAILTLIALEVLAADVSVHGYVAQGLTSSIDSEFITTDNQVTLELSEVGVNAKLAVNQDISFAGQVVYVDGGNRYAQGIRLDYLFVDWRVRPFYDWQLNVHLGRYKNYHWLYSATQDVPQTRPSITLPQSIYFDGNRDIALNSDGIAVQGSRSIASGNLDLRWSYGHSQLPQEQTTKYLGPLAQGRVKQSFVHQFSAYWQPSSMQWQIGSSAMQSDFTYKAGENDLFLAGKATVERLTLAVRYDSDNWEFTSELLRDRLRYESGFKQSEADVIDKTGEGGYFQLRYFVDPSITALLRLDTYDLDRHDRNGSQLANSAFGPIPQHYGYMDSLTLGMTVDFHARWRLSGEFSRTRGAARLAPVMIAEALVKAEPYWSAWSIELMYWF